MNRRINGNGKSDLAVNGDLIARAMTAQRLSTRELSRRVGLTLNIIYRMTKHNAFSGDLPTRYLIDIAERLHVTVPDLLSPAHHPVDEPAWQVSHPDDQAGKDEDMRRLAHYLLTQPGSPQPADLAYAFGWAYDRLLAARRAVNIVLEPIGLHISHANGTFCVTPLPGQASRWKILDEHSRVAITASHHRRIDPGLARVLDDTMQQRLGTLRSNNEQVKLAQAVNLGCIGTTAGRTDYSATPAFLEAFPDNA